MGNCVLLCDVSEYEGYANGVTLLVSSRKVLNNNVRYMKYMIYYPKLVSPNDKQLIVFV